MLFVYGTSQVVENAKLDYSPDIQLKQLALPLSETVMARYPDYRMAYWKHIHMYKGICLKLWTV